MIYFSLSVFSELNTRTPYIFESVFCFLNDSHTNTSFLNLQSVLLLLFIWLVLKPTQCRKWYCKTSSLPCFLLRGRQCVTIVVYDLFQPGAASKRNCGVFFFFFSFFENYWKVNTWLWNYNQTKTQQIQKYSIID